MIQLVEEVIRRLVVVVSHFLMVEGLYQVELVVIRILSQVRCSLVEVVIRNFLEVEVILMLHLVEVVNHG